tara:strand:- start:544 stop:792 length:249 start_codon:yes stop_codon:yes gene_type:complete
MKTQLMVSNEGDLEHNVNYVTKLALEPGKEKKLEITFPSHDLMHIFMDNLFKTFIVNRVPRKNNLDLVLNVPKEPYGDTNNA